MINKILCLGHEKSAKIDVIRQLLLVKMKEINKPLTKNGLILYYGHC